ncbi:MAG: coenzyme F430 synthase [Methanobrevibacter sp.]
MDYLVVDMTHGGIKIAISLKKQNNESNVYGYDIYNTLHEDKKRILQLYGIIMIEDISKLKNIKNLNIVSPIHCMLQKDDYKKIINPDIKYYTHHDGVKLILNKWTEKMEKSNIPIIEVTGVKGKTSTCFILKEILDDPLILSSFGAYLFKNNKKITLAKNISITPANIIETVDTAEKIENPKCGLENDGNTKNNIGYGSAIFESSLGACGIGDIGILTNIVENYPIAKGKSNAQIAKKQIFNCKNIIANLETLNEYYPEFRNKDNINTFTIYKENTDNNGNLIAKDIEYSLEKTSLNIEYNGLITTSGKKISGEFNVEVFAPGEYHVMNYLAAITCGLSLGMNDEDIAKKVGNFKGLPGRTSLKKEANSIIIEEINPGINTNAIEKSIKMISQYNNYSIIIGGKYGITCEEINEEKLGETLDRIIIKNPKLKIILTDELGKSLISKIKNNEKGNIEYINKLDSAINQETKNNKNILLIYRSNYSQINKR